MGKIKLIVTLAMVVFALGFVFFGARGRAVTTNARSSAMPDGTIDRVPNPQLSTDLERLPGDLRAIPVPEPPNLDEFVSDPEMARALGKALFWDMQVGSDGVQSCASCHFRAGADPRSKNQLNPGLRRAPDADLTFTTAGPNHQLGPNNFPLTRLLTPGVRGALDPATDSNDIVSSQGVHFLAEGPDPLGFHVGSVKTRRVAPRNTPSVINAIFNHRQFWDGRAENIFNGVNPLGQRDPDSKLFRADDPRHPVEVRVEIPNASLASQAVGPILSDFEMAVPGQTTQEVGQALVRGKRAQGKRVAKIRPLAKQQVSPTDSVLGSMSRWPNRGLSLPRYDRMIKTAFHPKWWKSKKLIRVNADGSRTLVSRNDGECEDEATCAENEYSLMQYNFSLFFGLAVQMYESTLVSDNTPWDQFRREHPEPADPDLNPWTNTNPGHISRTALFGAHLFNGSTSGSLPNARCSTCHAQAELTDGSARLVAENGPVRTRTGSLIDRGFNNIGVRPTSDDLGAGATDGFGPLSFTRRQFPGEPPATFGGAAVTGFGVDGAFKIPSLRNVALTAPYFHNGDVMTLRQVIELYNRGGNVAPITNLDGTTIGPVGVLQLTDAEIDALVAFLEALTDERVLYQRAPFDHPQLFIPNGHAGSWSYVYDTDGDGMADDRMVEIPAVGAAGGAPLPGFMQGIFGP